MIHEGSRVAYVGDPHPLLPVGHAGRVLMVAGASAHVQWDQGSVTLHDMDDLVPATGARQAAAEPTSPPPAAVAVTAQMDDSLEFDYVQHVAVRDIYDVQGLDGVLGALSESGAVGNLASLGWQALEQVSAQVRGDEVMASYLGDLDETERAEVVSAVATHVLRSALDAGEDD